jgi:anti-sigma factor RsiW
LSAYVDNELDSEESATVRRHLESCGACRERLQALDALGRLVRQAPYYSAPATLHARLASAQAAAGRGPRLRAGVLTRGRFTWAVMTALATAAILTIGVLVWRPPSPPGIEARGIADTIVDNHLRALVGDHLLDVASTDRHTVKPWFQGRLDFSPPVEDLAAQGFPLIGGRAEYVGGHQAAALIYRRGQHTINVFVWPAPADGAATPMESRTMRGYHLRHWSRPGMTWWAISDLNEAELDTFVQALAR